MAPADGSWLLEHTAQRATLQSAAGSGAMLLTLNGTTPTVRALARGDGKAFDFQPLGDFVKSWHTFGFDRVSPTAAVVAGKRTLLVKLSKPHLGPRGALRYVAKPLHGPPPAHLRYFARKARSSLPSRLGATSVFLDDANNAPVGVRMGLGSPNGWAGTISLSSPVVESIYGQGTPVNLSLSGSSIALTLYEPTGEIPEQMSLQADPLGQCVMVTVNSESSIAITAEAGVGPILSLGSGLNGLPTVDEAKCPHQPPSSPGAKFK